MVCTRGQLPYSFKKMYYFLFLPALFNFILVIYNGLQIKKIAIIFKPLSTSSAENTRKAKVIQLARDDADPRFIASSVILPKYQPGKAGK